jgi:hypothetical protein
MSVHSPYCGFVFRTFRRGFGSQMANTPMVIMWANSDGTVTLSQRQAQREVMPTVVANPPRVATLNDALSIVSGQRGLSCIFSLSINRPQDLHHNLLTPSPYVIHLRKFRTNSFLVLKANSDQKQSVIFAFGTQNPGSSAVDATLAQHVEDGVLQLDLTKSSSTSNGSTGTSSGTGSSSTSSSGADTSGVDSIPLLPYQRMIIAHATFCTVGFLLFLPAGSLLARYSRTFTSMWFKGHWIAQFALGESIPPIFLLRRVQLCFDSGSVNCHWNRSGHSVCCRSRCHASKR